MNASELFALLDKAADAAFAVDRQGRVCYWSQKAEQLLGFPKEKALLTNCDQLLAGVDDADCSVCCADCQVIELARKRGEVPTYDLHAATAGGDRRWLNISIMVAEVSQGPSPLIIHLMRDIEGRKRAETLTREIMVRLSELSGSRADDVLHRGLCSHSPVDLTSRELSILQLLSTGRNTKDIADRLHISTTTVRNHIQHSLKKLQCHTRLEAVIRAAREGLI